MKTLCFLSTLWVDNHSFQNYLKKMMTLWLPWTLGADNGSFQSYLKNLKTLFQPKFQRRMNVGSMLRIEITLIWLWNKTKCNVGFSTLHVVTMSVCDVETTLKQSCTTLIQRLTQCCTTSFWLCFNGDTTLYQRCFNVATLLVKAISKKLICF